MPSTPTEEFEICICGCGPTGALLSANLARLGIRHVILEKEDDITTDPRGIVLDEDGIRCLQAVGKYEELFREVGKRKSCGNQITGDERWVYSLHITDEIHSSGNVPIHRGREGSFMQALSAD